MSNRWTFQQEYVKCGKRGCKGCPHGPYWYSYKHENGRMHKRYHGKHHPNEKHERPTRTESAPSDPRDLIFNKRTATPALARQILGLGSNWTVSDMNAAYKRLVMQHHPDRGGDAHECQLVTAAYSFLKSYASTSY